MLRKYQEKTLISLTFYKYYTKNSGKNRILDGVKFLLTRNKKPPTEKEAGAIIYQNDRKPRSFKVTPISNLRRIILISSR